MSEPKPFVTGGATRKHGWFYSSTDEYSLALLISKIFLLTKFWTLILFPRVEKHITLILLGKDEIKEEKETLEEALNVKVMLIVTGI